VPKLIGKRKKTPIHEPERDEGKKLNRNTRNENH
jgi:hypothetical protein